MILLVDIGNRRLKWGTDSDGDVAAGPAVAWRDLSPDEWLQLFDPVAAPSRVLLCNVAGPQLESQLARVCRERWGLTPESLHSSARCHGVTNGYATPGELGVDRWAAIIGAYSQAPGDLVVIDAGTAVTIDLVEASGRHWGGAIFPGLQTMRDSLRSATHRLGVAAEGAAEFADGTAAAIAAGTLQVLVGGVDRYIELARQRLRRMPVALATGGDGAVIAELSRHELRVDPDLVLKGLARALKDE